MTLTEFLTARLDEDEAVARHAASVDDGLGRPNLMPMKEGMRVGGDDYYGYCVEAQPARVLAEVEAKRRIVTTYAAHEDEPMSSDSGFHNCGDSCVYSAMDWTLKVLALPYASHVDYDEAWRP